KFDFFHSCVGFHYRNRFGLGVRKRNEPAELTKLPDKRRAKMSALSDVERPITRSMVAACKSDHIRFAGGQHCSLQSGFNRFKAGVAEDSFRPRLWVKGGFATRILVLKTCCPPFECEPAHFLCEFL